MGKKTAARRGIAPVIGARAARRKLPGDGVVVEGHSKSTNINDTEKPLPVEKEPNQMLSAQRSTAQGSLLMRAERVGFRNVYSAKMLQMGGRG